MSRSNSPLTIFISSTFSDLIKYREVTNQAIQNLRDHANDMIFWPSDDRSSTMVSIEEITKSDLVLLIIAHKYGSYVPNTKTSFIELEFFTAIKNNLPILAFLVDEDYPWIPKYMEEDPVLLKKLRTLKEEVKKQCIVKFFTTPDSLAIHVTQAIANFDKRHGIQKIIEPPIKLNELIKIKESKDISTVPDINILIGQSPDELSLILNINRSIPYLDDLESIADSLDLKLTDSPFSSFSKILEDLSYQTWCKKGIYDIELPSKENSKCYISCRNLSDLFSPSLLRRVLKTPIGCDIDSIGNNYESNHTTVSYFRTEKDNRVQSLGGKNRFLAISLNDSNKYVVGYEDVNSNDFIYWREFMSESILCFKDVLFKIFISNNSEFNTSTEWDKFENYPKTLFKLFKDYKYNEKIRFSPQFKVSYESIIGIIIQIATQLAQIHKKGFIHGDVKPQNVLLTKNTPILIDGIFLKIGEIPITISPGWSAPEQIILSKVCEASDIYPLGMMLVSLLDGQITGEVSQYILPNTISNKEGVPIKFIKDPLIYIKPNNEILNLKFRNLWLDFIESCLRFNPFKRPSTIEFIKKLQTLLNDCCPVGYKTFSLWDVESIKLAKLPNGTEKLCWIVSDFRGMPIIHEPESYIID